LARASGAAALRGHPLLAIMDNGPAAEASKHTTAPINHTTFSPREHSPGGATMSEVADI